MRSKIFSKEFTVKGSVTPCCMGCGQGPNHTFISGIFFSHHFRPFLCFPSLSSIAKWSLRDLGHWGSAVSSPQRGGIGHCSYQTRTVGSKCTKMHLRHGRISSPENVSSSCRRRPVSDKRNLKIEADARLFLNVLYVTV